MDVPELEIVLTRVHSASGSASAWWHHRAFTQTAGPEVQLRQDDLPQVSLIIKAFFIYCIIVCNTAVTVKWFMFRFKHLALPTSCGLISGVSYENVFLNKMKELEFECRMFIC